MTRIAMFSWESMHSIAVGGLAPHITELSEALARRGHEVHIFTRLGKGQRGYDLVEGVHYHRCPFYEDKDFSRYVDNMCASFVWHLGETEAFLGRPFDVVHGHDWLSTRAIAEVKNDRRQRVVMTIHSTEFGRCGNTHWDDSLSRKIRDMEWEGTYIADRVICVSRTLKREVQGQYGVPADKAFAIYNGVKVGRYDIPVDVPRVRREYEIGVDDPMVLFAGRVTWQKGPDLLLEAVPRVLAEAPRAKILFAGEGDMRSGLEDRVRDLGLAPSIRFVGHRSGRDLVNLFRSADMVCVPSRNEPFGIVILEAWSASKPVVATRIGGPAEFVRDDYSGLIVDVEIEQIGGGVETMLGDRDAATQMGKNGRREAETKFTWDHAAARTEMVYHSIWDPTIGRQLLQQEADGEEATNMAKTTGTTGTKTTRRNGNGAGTSTNAKRTGGTATLTEPTQDQIRQRAYEIFTARNGAAGDPRADWLQAERELRAELNNPTRMGKRA